MVNGMRLATAWLMGFILLWPVTGMAAQLLGVSVEKSASGDIVHVAMDAATDYQVYDLKAPARLVLSFPGTGLAHDIRPLKFASAGVTAVYARRSDEGVRLEIGLDRPLAYRIEEQGKSLKIHFSGVPAEAAQPAKAAAELADLEVRDGPGVTELVVRGKQMNASHNAYVTNNGRTMIIDFWGGVSRLPKEFYSFASQRVHSVTVGQADGRTRLVVSLVPGVKVPHQIEATSGQLVVRFGGTKPRHKAVIVEGVTFQPAGQSARLVVRTSTSNPVINLYEQNGNMLLDIDKADLARGQERSLDVRDFPGPVSQVDTYKVGNGVRIVARLREKASFASFQHGNILTVTLSPEMASAPKAGKAGAALAYSGKPVSFDFKDIDIRNALKMIAELSGFNIIMADDVSGTLTMHLVDVPWDQALDLILSAKGLGKEQMGNVVRIVPLDVLRNEQQARLEVQQGHAQLAPLVTEYITLNFAKADEVMAMLQGSQQSEGTTSSGTGTTATTEGSSTGTTEQQNATTLLSERGSVQADTRTNTLIVTDTQNSVNNIKRLVEVLDKPVRQVLIEARIVEATDKFTRDLGVRWGGQFTGTPGNRFPSTVNVGAATGVASTTASRGFIVDLPAAISTTAPGGAVGVALGSLNSAINLDLELSAAESDNKIKIVSRPRLITANLQEAYIKQGDKVPIVTPATTTEPATTELVDAVLELKVTPQITADKNIMLDILITKDAAADVQGLTGISTKEIKTNVLLKNGETVVIGGIYTKEKENTVQGIPGLKDIPLLGWLFKTKLAKDNRTELLIFLTPKIIEQSPVKSGKAASI